MQQISSSNFSEKRQGYVNLGHNQKEKFLENSYKGKIIKATELLGKPLKMGKWEIKPSKFHEGKECLYAQVGFVNENGSLEIRLLVTEAWDLIQDLKDLRIKKNGDFKKIIYTSLKQEKEGKIIPEKLTKDEVDSLKDIYLD